MHLGSVADASCLSDECGEGRPGCTMLAASASGLAVPDLPGKVQYLAPLGYHDNHAVSRREEPLSTTQRRALGLFRCSLQAINLHSTWIPPILPSLPSSFFSLSSVLLFTFTPISSYNPHLPPEPCNIGSLSFFLSTDTIQSSPSRGLWTWSC